MSTYDHEFTPVPRQSSRHDGWTEDKQRGFIAALAHYSIVRAAAEKVGMGAVGAYRLREAEGAKSFCDAWDTALKIGMSNLADIAMDRAINGVAVAKYYKGEQIGEGRWFDNRLLMFMMKQNLSRRYGPHAAEYDFVDEALATERAERERTREKLIRAQDLLESMTELLESQDEQRADGHEMCREEYDKLCARRDRLDELVTNLTAADPVAALEAVSPLALNMDNPAYLTAKQELDETVERMRQKSLEDDRRGPMEPSGD